MSPEGSRAGKRRYSQTFPAILQVMHERHYLRHQKTKQSVHINEILAVRYVQTPPFDLLHLLKVNSYCLPHSVALSLCPDPVFILNRKTAADAKGSQVGYRGHDRGRGM